MVQDAFNAVNEFHNRDKVQSLYKGLELVRTSQCQTEPHVQNLCYSVINVSLLNNLFVIK